MGWLNEEVYDTKHQCPLPRRELSMKPEGAIWKCDECGKKYKKYTVYYNHDIMPGEKDYQETFKPL